MKYAVVGDEFIETAFWPTEAEAIEEFNQASDYPFDEEHSVQGYSDEEIAQIEAYSEAHPQ